MLQKLVSTNDFLAILVILGSQPPGHMDFDVRINLENVSGGGAFITGGLLFRTPVIVGLYRPI